MLNIDPAKLNFRPSACPGLRSSLPGYQPQRTAVLDAAKGRWRDILRALGFNAKTLSGKHGPCPICGGKDRFRFDDKGGRGTWICTRCGSGDGIKLLMLKTGLDFRAAAQRVEGILGTARRYEPKLTRSDDDRRSALNSLWLSAVKVHTDDPVGLYIRRRVGVTSYPDCIRCAPWVRYQAENVSYHPCMITMIRDVSGRPATLHRTYLTKEGSKADLSDPRRLMPGPMPAGSAVRLFDSAPEMGIAEGIENALSAAFLSGLPVWAAVTAGNLAEWMPPSGVRKVTIFGDNDASFTGQAAAFKLAQRMRTLGITVVVDFPEDVDSDWNDVLRPL